MVKPELIRLKNVTLETTDQRVERLVRNEYRLRAQIAVLKERVRLLEQQALGPVIDAIEED